MAVFRHLRRLRQASAGLRGVAVALQNQTGFANVATHRLRALHVAEQRPPRRFPCESLGENDDSSERAMRLVLRMRCARSHDYLAKNHAEVRPHHGQK